MFHSFSPWHILQASHSSCKSGRQAPPRLERSSKHECGQRASRLHISLDCITRNPGASGSLSIHYANAAGVAAPQCRCCRLYRSYVRVGILGQLITLLTQRSRRSATRTACGMVALPFAQGRPASRPWQALARIGNSLISHYPHVHHHIPRFCVYSLLWHSSGLCPMLFGL